MNVINTDRGESSLAARDAPKLILRPNSTMRCLGRTLLNVLAVITSEN